MSSILISIHRYFVQRNLVAQPSTQKRVPFFSGSLLLESKIQQDTAYQKQQETLIVWSEGENYDLALSFQEKAGCDEIWEKICQVKISKFSQPFKKVVKWGFVRVCVCVLITLQLERAFYLPTTTMA